MKKLRPHNILYKLWQGECLNFKVCSPLKLRSGLAGDTTQSATTHTIFRYASL